MKTWSISLKPKGIMLAFVLALPFLSAAGVIQLATAPYVSQPEIRFAIAAPASAPASATSPSPASKLSPAQSAPVISQFEIRPNDLKLHTAFARWAAEKGVRVKWDADKHVLIGAPMTFKAENIGDAFAQALATPGIQTSGYPLEVCEYPNTPVFYRVTRQGEQTKDCPIIVR